MSHLCDVGAFFLEVVEMLDPEFIQDWLNQVGDIPGDPAEPQNQQEVPDIDNDAEIIQIIPYEHDNEEEYFDEDEQDMELHFDANPGPVPDPDAGLFDLEAPILDFEIFDPEEAILDFEIFDPEETILDFGIFNPQLNEDEE